MSKTEPSSLNRLFADILREQSNSANKLPPVDKWNPPFCGDMDMRIARDGTWYHEGVAIRREAMVRLFSSILKREGDDYFLVTPVEKMRIQVEDAPFTLVSLQVENRQGQQALLFTSNTGDKIVAGEDHLLRVVTDPETGEPSPYLLIRNNLEGLISRPVFYQLVELAEERSGGGETWLEVESLGQRFRLGSL